MSFFKRVFGGLAGAAFGFATGGVPGAIVGGLTGFVGAGKIGGDEAPGFQDPGSVPLESDSAQRVASLEERAQQKKKVGRFALLGDNTLGHAPFFANRYSA